MNVLRVFLGGVAATFLAVAIGGVVAITKGWVVLGGIVALSGLALAVVVYQQARRFTIQSTESQHIQFEETARELAKRSGGAVPLQALLVATGYARDRAEREMRTLVGRGIFELDFGDDGQVRYKLTPFDEARAALTSLEGKRLPP